MPAKTKEKESKGTAIPEENGNGNGNGESGRKPVFSTAEKGISVALWENEGKTGKYFAVSIRKSYMDKKAGEWRTQHLSVAGAEGVDRIISLLQQIREQM